MHGDYKLIEVTQGSQEWLEWRHNGIGASDASVVMGQNPWKNPYELLRQKILSPNKDFCTSSMIKGIQLEPKARNLYNKKYSKSIKPVCIQSSTHIWLKASLDGLSIDKKEVVEIKCGEKIYRSVKEKNKVPEYYYGQLQHILAITGLDEITFFCYWPENPEQIIKVSRNNKYIQKLIEEEQKFWVKVSNLKLRNFN